MSSKSTVLHTGGDHWFTDFNSEYFDKTRLPDALYLSFSQYHEFEDEGKEGISIIIERDSDIYKELMRKLRITENERDRALNKMLHYLLKNARFESDGIYLDQHDENRIYGDQVANVFNDYLQYLDDLHK